MPRQAVLFLLDTQGANTVGCYRPDLALETPNIDRLAAGAVRFDHAYTSAPVCGPARSALLTGLHPHSNGVLANNMAPHLDLPTIGQRLRAAGFATGYIGKWHLDATDYFGSGRCPDGWDPDYWFDGLNYLESLPDDAARDLSRRMLGPEEVAAHGIASDFTHAHRSADRAMDYIGRHRDEDFFLVVSIDEPHHPAIAPEPYVSAFEDFLFPVPNARDPLSDKPRGQREWAEHEAIERGAHVVWRDGSAWMRLSPHFACNSYADSQVGRVLDAIDALTPGAMVIHTSDHGDMLGSHGLHGKGPCMYEEIVRVPLIVRAPALAPAGAVSAGVVSHVDVVPTLLEHFGVRVPDLLQGRSLLSQLTDPSRPVNRRVFVEFHRFELDQDGWGAFAPIRCVFDGRFKLAINLLDDDELYDHASDPGELENLIGDPRVADVRDALHAEVLAWMDRTRDPLRGPHWSRRAWGGDHERTAWGGKVRPRPADDDWLPRSRLYETGRIVDRDEYDAPAWAASEAGHAQDPRAD